MKSQSPFLCAALIFPALFMLSGIVAAQTIEARSFPGSMCQPSSPSDQFSRNDFFGRMFNVDPQGTPPQFWICPIQGPVVEAATASFIPEPKLSLSTKAPTMIYLVRCVPHL
jgi:hypothetical protein